MLLPQQSALVQSTRSVQGPISRPLLSPAPPFNAHIDPAEIEFLKKKVGDWIGSQGKVLLEEGNLNPYFKVIAVLEQSPREGK